MSETDHHPPTADRLAEGDARRTLALPALSLVALVGPSGCGKSTFARRHFLATEVVSSDHCRALVSDDAADQSATDAAFELLHLLVAKRLERGRLTVVDATNVTARARLPLVELARRHHVNAVAIVFDLPESLCHERNRARGDRVVPDEVVHDQRARMHHSLHELHREGFRDVHLLRSAGDVDAATIERRPAPSDRRWDRGPFDIVGDVHGCGDELEELLATLGYAADAGGVWRHPQGRRALFLGDLVDRGPRIVDVLRIAIGMVDAGTALCLPGNHDAKLMRALRGRNVRVTHGLQRSLEELARETPEFRRRVADFVESLESHYVLDDGRLVVAHAGMKETMQGRESHGVRDFALYGDTTGKMDEHGLPVRLDWAADYRGQASVVYGHTPVATPAWRNRTINIDTGCVYGGRLTALRYPECELVSVAARRTYAVSRRQFLAAADSAAG